MAASPRPAQFGPMGTAIGGPVLLALLFDDGARRAAGLEAG